MEKLPLNREMNEVTYEEYEQKCKEIRSRNETFLNEFREDMVKSGLKEKTIENHCDNVEFYINTYLLRREALEMRSGATYGELNGFLGDFFIRKCMWSSPSAIKGTAASFKKFYKSMLQRDHINEQEYKELTETIKDNMEDWLEEYELFY